MSPSEEIAVRRGIRRGLALSAEILATFILGRMLWLLARSPGEISGNLKGAAMMVLLCGALLSFGTIAWRGRPFEAGRFFAWLFLLMGVVLAIVPTLSPDSASWLLYVASGAAFLVGWNQIRRVPFLSDEERAA